MKNRLFAKITKVDEAQRLVFGVLAEERVDKDTEIMDYEGSKPYFEKWNSNFENATDGKSVGNLRAMHEKIAAGLFTSMSYNDDAKQIEVCAKVVDDSEWTKVTEGVYTGFSIGARRVKSWVDKVEKALRWIADPYEGSLVDNPCMYGAQFTAVKADGANESRDFAGRNTNAEKGLYGVHSLAECCSCLSYLASDMQYEADCEGDDSPLPARARDLAKELLQLLVDYTTEEAAEAAAALDAQASGKSEGANMKTTVAEPGARPKTTTVVEPGDRVQKTETPVTSPESTVEKKKTPNKAELLATVAAITEQINALTDEAAASTEGAQSVTDEKVAKMVVDAQKLVDKVATLETENAALKAQFTSEITKLNEKLAEIANKPIPSALKLKGSVTVDKEHDNGGEGGDEDVAKDAKPTSEPNNVGVVNVIKSIHAGGPSQRR